MVSQQVIELAIKTVGAEKAAADLDRVAKAEREVASGGGGFGGQLEGTTTQGRQVEESLVRAVSTAQDELNNKLAIGKEHSIFMVRSKELELQGVRDVEQATERLVQKQLAQAGAAKLSHQGMIALAKGLAADAAIAGSAISAAMGANKLIWGESLAMADRLAERDREFAAATENSRYALSLLSGDFSKLKDDADWAWKGITEYASKHADVLGGIVGGPIGAAVGSYIQKLKDIMGAADASWEAADESQKKLAALVQANANEHAEMLASGKAFFEAYTEADNAYTQLRLANAAKIHRAEAELKAGRAKRAGGSEEDLAAGSLEANVQAAQDTKAIAEAVAKSMTDRNNIAWREVFDRTAAGAKPEEIARLTTAAQKAAEELERAQANVKAIGDEAAPRLTNQLEEVGFKLKDATEKNLTDWGSNLVAALEKEQESGQLDARGLVAVKNVRKLMDDDQKITADEAEGLKEAAKLLRGSASAAFGDVGTAMNQILGNVDGLVAVLKTHEQKIAQQGVLIERLSAQ